MAQLHFPLDDHLYSAENLQLWLSTRTNGVFSSNNDLICQAQGGMVISISPGIAWLSPSRFMGAVYGNTQATQFTLATADGLLTRIDRVVIRWDFVTNDIVLQVKKGTPGSNPISPALQRNAEAFELGIWDIRVNPGVLAVTQGNISDLRMNESLCGIMQDGVTGIPTQALYDAWYAWFNSLKTDAESKSDTLIAWINLFKAQNEQDFNAWFSSFRSANAEIFNNWANEFFTDSEGRFYSWFEDLQNTLDENQAANLFNKIDRHERLNPARNVVHGTRMSGNNYQIFDNGWITVATAQTGLSWDYIDGRNLMWQEWDFLDYTWDEFESLIERERDIGRSWRTFNSNEFTVDEINEAQLPWEAINVSYTGIPTGSSNKTEHLELNLWSLDDVPQMDDFNTDNQKIDDAFSNISQVPDAEKVVKASYLFAKRMQCGPISATVSTPWNRVASIIPDTANTDYSIIFHVYEAYVTGYPIPSNNSICSGILKISFRIDSSIPSGVRRPFILWEYISGFDPSNFVLAYSPTSENPVCELWAKETKANNRITFEMMTEGTATERNHNFWTVYDMPTGVAEIPAGRLQKVSEIMPLKQPDSGWVDLPLLNGFTAYGGLTANIPKVRKVGSVIQAKGIISPPSGNTLGTSLMIFCTLPAGFRPSTTTLILQQGHSTAIWLCGVTSDGSVRAELYRDGTTLSNPANTAWMPFNVQFLVD